MLKTAQLTGLTGKTQKRNMLLMEEQLLMSKSSRRPHAGV